MNVRGLRESFKYFALIPLILFCMLSQIERNYNKSIYNTFLHRTNSFVKVFNLRQQLEFLLKAIRYLLCLNVLHNYFDNPKQLFSDLTFRYFSKTFRYFCV